MIKLVNETIRKLNAFLGKYEDKILNVGNDVRSMNIEPDFFNVLES